MISVIIPIYNVEKYLRKCLDSLSKQTFPDVEFILVDDGSTDRSGTIADQYHYNDDRFSVYHTENHGLSAARNLGIEKAQGEWLMFVDGDDWVASGFCAISYKAAMEYGADLVIFSAYEEKRGMIKRIYKKISSGIIDASTAYSHGGVAVWNKMYHRKLFNMIRYPEKRVFEDVATTHKLIHEATQICFIQEPLYHHVYRKNSISNTDYVSYKRDNFLAARERQHDLISYGYSGKSAGYRLHAAAIGFIASTEPSNDKVYQDAIDIMNSISGKAKWLSWKQRAMLSIWRINKSLFYKLCRFTGRIT